MLRRLRSVSAVLAVSSVLLEVSPALADWQPNVNYGGSTKMDLYTPAGLPSGAPIVVTLHYCSGSASAVHSWLQSYADQYKFAIIAPTAGGNCFDATPARSGERAAIVSMVNYVIMQKGSDPKRVYSVGASSGACMTQALLAAYPDVFAAGSSLAGVPAGAWTGGNDYAWSTSGVSGGQAWGDKVRQADPGFSGTRPRVQLWQGQGDTTLTYSQTYPAEVAQWTNVFAVTDADGTMAMIKPMGAQDTWARTSYKDDNGVVVVEANSGPSNVPHDLTSRGLWPDVIRFFGLDQPATGTGGAGGMGAGGAASGGAGGLSGMAGRGGGGVPGSGGMGMSMAGSGGTGPAAGAGGTAMAAAGTGGTAIATGGTGGTSMTGSGGTGAVAGMPGMGAGGTGANGGTGPTGTGGASAGRSGGFAGTGTSGGKNGSSGDDGTDTGSDTGCGCRVAPLGGESAPAALAALGLGALGLAFRRRRRG